MLRDIASITPKVRALARWPERWDGKLCKRCEEVARERHLMGRRAVWDSLPSIFDFTDWNDLLMVEEDKVECIKAVGAFVINTVVCQVRERSCTGIYI